MATSYRDLRSTQDILSRTNHGHEIAQMLQSLGFWVRDERTHTRAAPQAFPTNVEQIETPTALADAQLYWQSELSRVTELLGVLEGERFDAKQDAKRVRNEVGAQLLDEQQTLDAKDRLKSTELKMKAEIDQRVTAADERVSFVEMLISSLDGLRSSIEGKCRVLSREQTRRDNELQTRIRHS